MATVSMEETRTMIEAVRDIPPVSSFLKNTFFKEIKTFPTEAVDFDYQKGNAVMAPFVAPSVGGIPLERQGFVTDSFVAPRVSPERSITIENLSKRGMGEPLYSPKTPEDRSREMQARDYDDLDAAISRREEWMCREALFNGTIILKGKTNTGEDVEMSVDYKFDNKEALSGGDLWNNDAADPILHGVKWRKEIVASCGVSPNVMLMDSETALILTNNKHVKERFDIQRFNFGTIEPFIKEPLLTFYGRLPILGADVYAYDAMYKDPDTGKETPYIPPKTVLFASTLTPNRMYYGAITIMDNAGAYHTVEMSRVPTVFFDPGSTTKTLRVQSRPLPVPFNVEGWAVRVVW